MIYLDPYFSLIFWKAYFSFWTCKMLFTYILTKW